MKTILVKSGWQTINIGDIGHTPGLLHILEERFPSSRIILWINDDSMGVGKMLQFNFPKVKIIKGFYDGKENIFSCKDLEDAFTEADILIQSSSPMIHKKPLRSWIDFSDKPFGIFGVTLDKSYLENIESDPELKQILDKASFIFTRETTSLKNLQQTGTACPNVRYTPDACVASSIEQEEVAKTYLKENDLKEKEFICVIPRLRTSPTYCHRWETPWSSGNDMPEFHKRHNPISQSKIKEIEELNYRHRAEDMAKLREVIVYWVRQTNKKVLLCPEMTYQLYLLGNDLYAPLPEDVKSNVIIKDRYWLTDEAASVYKRAFALVSQDCHSPLLAYNKQTPALYLRQEGSTGKGQMYYDFGLSDWVFEYDKTQASAISKRLLEIYENPEKASKYLGAALNKIEKEHKVALDIIETQLKAI